MSYAQMKELDKEAKTTTNQEIMEMDTKQINTMSIKYKVNDYVNPETDLTLCVAISKNAEEIVSPNSVEELMISLRATAIKESFSLSIPLTENKPARSLLSIEKLHDDTPSCCSKI